MSSATGTMPQEHNAPTFARIQNPPVFVPQIPTRFQMLTPEKQRHIEARIRQAFGPRTINPHERPTASQVAQAVYEAASVTQNIEFAFKAYKERQESDIQDLQFLCGALVAIEQQEKEQWKSLAMKVMQERDAARAIIVRASQASLSQGNAAYYQPTTPPAAASQTTIAGEAAATTFPKREDTRSISPRSQPAHSVRPMRSLPGSRSTSPYSSSQFQYHPHSPSASEAAHTPPPDSATSESSSSSFNGARAPQTVLRTPPTGSAPQADALRSRSASPRAAEEPADPSAPVPKRRKSCDSTFSVGSTGSLDSNSSLAGQNRGRPTTTPALPSDFPLVDLMFLPQNGSLVCRVCYLAASKVPAGQPRVVPATYPATQSWDVLKDHCLHTHRDACNEMIRLHPAEAYELRIRRFRGM